VASSDDRGREVFRSDGTSEGTVILKDIALRSSANPEDLTVCNGLLFFSADAAHAMTGRELYVSDGTPNGTSMLKDVNRNGTGLVSRITAVGDSIFFVASNGLTGVELWRSDGTDQGTVIVKDIEPGPDSSLPQDLIDANGMLYFKADDGTHGFELWKSDGTESGTVMVADLYEDEADGEPEGLTVASVAPSNGFQVAAPTLFFAGYQRENGVTTGNELWKLPLPNGDVLSSALPSVEGPGAGFIIDSGKPVISLPAGTETSAGNCR
jgi:ELWxxDGT repeat protein